ncbi:MAG: archaemetzincin family Zn-dependent metalloprotease [Bacteroidales bacterium]|nr:archaemetzincin family Zn-dependent metalloprotease [Bacteroidales bacterium]MCF8337475.1 archaemetzincin family Zn-dependent metalloprotease [Bacteroidales bacterium]
MKEQKTITLVAFGYIDRSFVENVALAVEIELNTEVTTMEGHLDLSNYYDVKRRQYNGDELLKFVDNSYNSYPGKTMGLFGVDLFIPILTHIFGQAYLNGNTGVVSHFRLNNEFYGLKANKQLLQERFIKVVIHELGHTYGLTHCHVPTCVMRSSTYVEDLDQKSSSFCDNCRESIN